MALRDLQWYVDNLSAKKCLCGNKKKYSMAFCYRCFKRLPTPIKSDLYRPLKDGFEEAMDGATDFLGL